MTLTIIAGRAGSGKTDFCLNEAAEAINKEPIGRPILFLVPEQATFRVEQELATRMASNAFSRAHVTGFRRLAQRVLAETGGACRPLLSDLGKRLALRRLLVEHEGELRILGRAAKQRTFVETLVSAIWEFKTWCISPDQLEGMEQHFGDSPLTAKIHDLALIYRKFEDFLAGSYHDGEDMMTILAEKIPSSKLVEGADVYIDGFHWFSPQEYQILDRLLSTAATVTVTLCADVDKKDAAAAETDLFHKQWQTWRALETMARRKGVPVAAQSLLPGRRFKASPLLRFVEEHYFTVPAPIYSQEGGAVTAAEAANRRSEAEGIARELITLSRDRRYRWRDMAVLLRDTDNYSELMETVLTDHDIPFFSDRRRPAVYHPLAELIRSALETVSTGWPYEPLFRCLKTGLFPVEPDSIDILENYCLEFGIRGRRWTEDTDWSFVRRLALDEDSELTVAQESRLREVNAIREQIRQPLLTFQQEFKAGKNGADCTAAVYHFLISLGVPEKLMSWAAVAEESGDLDQSKEHLQLWAGVVGLLDQLVETCGDEELTGDEFGAVLGEGLEGLSLSLIPPGLDYVTLSSLERCRTEAFKAVFIPGVNEGVLPQRSREEGLLSDAERQLLADCGIELASGAMSNAFQEQFTVYNALTRASEYVWISYSLADEEGKALAPSLIFDRLKAIGAVRGWRRLEAEPEGAAIASYIVHPRSTLSALAGGLRAAIAEQNEDSLWWQVYNWACGETAHRRQLRQVVAGLLHRNTIDPLPPELAKQMYMKQGKLRGSVTRFETYQACPFQYFSRYGLNLKERPVFQLAAPDFGQFLHAVMKTFGDRIGAQGRRWHDVTPEEAAEYCQAITAELAPKLQNEILLSSRHYQHIQSRLEKTAAATVIKLTRFAASSAFTPVAMEQSFGRSGADWPPLLFVLPGGEQVELAGQIDRLDKVVHNNQSYVLIFDYKSGQASLRLSDVVHGLKLQLLTYLLAVCRVTRDEPEGALPAGALYCYLKNPKVTAKKMLTDEEVAKERAKQQKMPGWVLADPVVIKLLDSTIDGWSHHMKVWLKNSALRSNDRAVKTDEEFRLLMDHARQTVITAAQGILDGQAPIEPYKIKDRTPCLYCPYRAVCQFDSQLTDNAYRLLPDLADQEAWKLLTGGEEGGK